jgi:hypothetical protein
LELGDPNCHPPDHHDVAGEHAVDLDPQPGFAADVWYYDPRGTYEFNVRHADLSWLPYSCSDGTGGAAAIVSVNGIDSTQPTGERYLANAVYRHITAGAGAGPILNGTLLGGLAQNASTNRDCWDGAHLHQGVGSLGTGITLEHDVSGFEYPHCVGWVGAPYPGAGWAVGHPICYQIRWTG